MCPATLLLAWHAPAIPAETLAERHRRIIDHYEGENYAYVVKYVEQQLQEAVGTPWQDSLYKYCYMYGRAAWKSNNADSGIEAAQSICDKVKELDKDPIHLIDAMSDLSWLQYELGRMDQCIKTDSTAMVIADSANLSDFIRGRARHYVAFDHSVLGEHASGAKYFLEALRIYERSDSLMPMELAETCNGIGSAYWHLGRNKEAEHYYLKSLEWLDDSEDIDMVTRKASAVGNLALMWEDAGDLIKSKECYQQNLELNGKVIALATDPMMRDEAIMNRSRTYSNMAALYHGLGDMGTSRRLLDLAFKDRSSVLEPGDAKLLLLQELYSDLERSAGNLDKAEALIDEYLKVCETTYGPKSEYFTQALGKKAGIVADKGEHERAAPLFDRCIAEQRSIADETSDPWLATMYQERALSDRSRGHYKAALHDLLKTKEINKKVYGSKDRRVAQCDILIADVRVKMNDLEGAEQSINAALDILADRSSDQSNMPRIDMSPHLLPDAIYQHVRIRRAAGKGNATEHLAELRSAISSLDRNKAGIRDEESKLLLLGAQQRVFHLAEDIAFEEFERDPNDELKNTLFSTSEENRTVLLKSRLNTFSSLSFAGVPDSLIEREAQLVKGMSIDPENGGSAYDLPKNEMKFRAFLNDLKRDHPDYFKLKYGGQSLSIADVQKNLLEPEQSMIVFSLTPEHLYIVVIEKDRSELIRVPGKGLGELVSNFNTAMTSLDDSSCDRWSHELFQRVFEPIVPFLSNTELLIVPDEELYYLNFEALLSEPPSSSPQSKSFLIHQYTISYLLSATTAVQFKNLDRHRTQGALAIAPGFSDELKSQYLASVRDTSAIDRTFLQFIQQPFAVGTAREMEEVLHATVMLGNDADEGRFKQFAKDHSIIHLGTHTEVNNISPLYSRLVLSKGVSDISNMEDGYLHAYEIYAMELNAELAVLTACETGTGRKDNSEGVRSLAHSFAYAGCPSLVMSLWKIDEKTSSEIITSFYRNLSGRQAKNDALRNAKLEYLKNAPQELRSPYYWAGLVLVGDTAPVQLADNNAFNWWVFLAVLLGVVISLVIWRLRSNNA